MGPGVEARLGTVEVKNTLPALIVCDTGLRCDGIDAFPRIESQPEFRPGISLGTSLGALGKEPQDKFEEHGIGTGPHLDPETRRVERPDEGPESCW